MENSNETIADDQIIKVGDIFDVGRTVPQTGRYICVPCGYTRHLQKGTIFPQCFSCIEGKKYNGDIYFKDLGLWELLQ